MKNKFSHNLNRKYVKLFFKPVDDECVPGAHLDFENVAVRFRPLEKGSLLEINQAEQGSDHWVPERTGKRFGHFVTNKLKVFEMNLFVCS